MPIQGLSGSHAYARARSPASTPPAGERAYQPVYVPWGLVAGKWMIGGVSFSETLATALGIPFVMGVAQGISRARYYPDVKPIKVKLLAEPGTLRLIGAQMVGGEGIKERADFLAMAVRTGITLRDLATMENVYSPADRRAERADRAGGPERAVAAGRLTMAVHPVACAACPSAQLMVAAQSGVAERYGSHAAAAAARASTSSGRRSTRPSTTGCRGRCARASMTRCPAATARRGTTRGRTGRPAV